MARQRATVTMVNPSKKKKSAGRKKSKTMAKKRRKTSTRRRRTTARRNPAPRRRRRSAARRNPAPRRRTGRSNPMGLKLSPKAWWNSGPLWRLGGKVVAAAAVMRFGDAPMAPSSAPFGSGAEFSATMGQRWTIKNALIGAVGAFIAGELVAQWKGKTAGQQVLDGAMDLILAKFVWTDVVSRWGTAQGALGRTLQPGDSYPAGMGGMDMGAMHSMGAMSNEIYQDNQGNVWMQDPTTGQMVSMQGLVQEGPLGGLVQEGPLGAYQANYLPAGTPDSEVAWSEYSGAGSSDPYAAAFGS